MSLDYDVMTKLKKEAPYLKCGYIIPLQFGHFKETSLDFFVIEDFLIRQDLLIKHTWKIKKSILGPLTAKKI